MDEEQWLNSTDPHAMLNWVFPSTSERKLRLFALACCRRVEHLLTRPGSREAVEFLRAHAEHGLARRKGVVRARQQALEALNESMKAVRSTGGREVSAAYVTLVALEPSSTYAADFAALNAAIALARSWTDCAELAHLLREVIGNPFRSVAVDAAWVAQNEAAVSRIGRSICEEEAFDQTPVLADALEDAGCTEEAILSHLRSAGPHVRGCWAIDLLLGR